MCPDYGSGDDVRLAPFHYELPVDQIARFPPAERDGGRLLCVDPSAGLIDTTVRGLPGLLQSGDLLVVNDTRVMHARVNARRSTGGRVEVLLLGREADEVLAMLRPARRIKSGERLSVVDASGAVVPAAWVDVVEPAGGGEWKVRPHPSADAVMAAGGAVPLPPYLHRPAETADAVRYQTVFAGPTGAVAAPTAGLHLSRDVLHELQTEGIEIAKVTLHVGAGTFRNLRSEDLDRGRLHEEWCELLPETASAVAAARARGGRVVAVGTTATRTLESFALPDGEVRSGAMKTDLFIRPGYRFRVVDSLFTNLHLPGSSLLMLTCAFGGHTRVMEAYRHAVRQGYRFFSYGDAMLITARVSGTG